MNWKFTLTLLAIVAALALFFEFYENKHPAPDPADKNRVFVFDRNQIDALTLTDHDQKIELVRGTGNKWTVKSPVTDRADQSLVDQVMTNLEILRWDDRISGPDVPKGKLSDYGLQSPRARLLITAHGGHPTEVLFGNETVIDGKTYLQLAGLGDVYVVNDELKKLVGKDLNSWRDHRLTDIAATDVTRFVLKNPAGEIDLQKDGEHWKIVKPLAARADDTKIKDTIAQITNLQVSSFVADDKADTASYGLATPKGTITLYTANEPKGTELLIGNPPPEPKPTPGASPALPPATPPESEAGALTVYARMPSRQSIYTVSSAVNTTLDLKPADLRDRSLVRLNLDTVDRAVLTPEAGTPFTLGHKNKAWTMLDGPAVNGSVDAEVIEKLLTALTGPNVADFVADSASDLAKYGLDKPLLQVKLGSYASENTAETNAGEKPIATVSFGKHDESTVYARVSDEPFVVSVPRALIDQLPTDPLLWQSRSIFQVDSSKVNTLEIAMRERPTLTLTHPDKGVWTTTGKPDSSLRDSKAESVVNTLTRLHVVRWEGALKPEYGLDKPAATFKFGSSSDGKIGGRLSLGGTAKDGTTYGMVDGKPGVFVISSPDANTLTAELLPPPTPAATPMASPEPTPAATPAP